MKSFSRLIEFIIYVKLRAVVGKLMKSVNFVNPQSANEFVSFAKVDKLTFLSNAEVKVEPLIR